MKKTLLLLTAILGTYSASAQLKIKAGTNISSINGSLKATLSDGETIYTLSDYKEQTKSKIGFYAGMGYKLNLTNKLYVTPELIYSQLGADAKNTNTININSYSQNYLSIPVFFEYELINGLRAGLGPQVDFLLKAIRKSDHHLLPEWARQYTVYEANITKIHNTLSFGLSAGLTYNFYNNFSIETRYYLGLSNIYNNDKKPIFDAAIDTDTEMKNQAFQIGLAYQFN
ncbi:porin family protein [Flavobacterium dauae]|uniref:porin family protein n=1 Tax=Flavobacterium dauae TaxID=1563479 RepID=UPI0013EC3139|nr:porin family protein [Flavobacterium dauae]WLD22649.1 porin family protein [Flavobacterium dauae]